MAIELKHVFELYAPTQCICKKPLDDTLRNEVVVDVKTKFATWFGGFSVMKIEGGWILPDGTLASEAVDVIRSNTDDGGHDHHADEIKQLAVTVADRLVQDAVFITIDGTGILFQRSETGEPTCSHGQKSGSPPPSPDPGPTPTHKLHSIYSALSHFDSLDHVKNLFIRTLNYKHSDGHLSCTNWPDSVKALVAELPEIIADHNGFRIVSIRLNGDNLSPTAERAVIRTIYQEEPSFTGMFVLSNKSQDQWAFVNAKTTGDKDNNVNISRMPVGKDQDVRTAAERMAIVEMGESHESATALNIQNIHDIAFEVESVANNIFKHYQETFDEIKSAI